MADVSRRQPFHIDSDLDGAHVQLLVRDTRGVSQRVGWSIGLAMLATLLLVGASAWAIVLFVCGGLGVFGWSLTLPEDRVLHLHLGRANRTIDGRPYLTAVLDYQTLVVDGTTHTIVGGLSKKEHACLLALLHPPERGDILDVPTDLRRLASGEPERI